MGVLGLIFCHAAGNASLVNRSPKEFLPLTKPQHCWVVAAAVVTWARSPGIQSARKVVSGFPAVYWHRSCRNPIYSAMGEMPPWWLWHELGPILLWPHWLGRGGPANCVPTWWLWHPGHNDPPACCALLWMFVWAWLSIGPPPGLISMPSMPPHGHGYDWALGSPITNIANSSVGSKAASRSQGVASFGVTSDQHYSAGCRLTWLICFAFVPTEFLRKPASMV